MNNTKTQRPEIRMNLTTKLRLLKANPLVQYNLLEKKVTTSNSSTKSSLSNLAKSRDIGLNTFTNAAYKPTTNFANKIHKKQDFQSSNNGLNHNHSTTSSYRSGIINKNLTNKTSKKPENNAKPSNNAFNHNRSISVDRCFGAVKRPANNVSNKNSTINTRVEQNKKPIQLKQKTFQKSDISGKGKPKTENTTRNQKPLTRELHLKNSLNSTCLIAPSTSKEVFKTPSAYRRRSIAPTLNTTGRKSTVCSGTASYDNTTLSNQLKKWLSSRGKSLGDFHHLKCFGLHSERKLSVRPPPSEDENKENIATSIIDRSSYEDLHIISNEEKINDEVKVEQLAEDNNFDEIAKAALIDLHNLILEGYPSEQCDIWLDLIHRKCKSLIEEPEYWECRAAIEQSRGNITSAVECYKTAIVQGAEVDVVDDHLDQLLQKFSLLDITKESQTKNAKNREKMINEARNVFKSSIIQFAVQEKTLKKKQKQCLEIVEERRFIATPVRRSTRISRSGVFTSTPGIKLFTTLGDVDEDLKKSLNFTVNTALLN